MGKLRVRPLFLAVAAAGLAALFSACGGGEPTAASRQVSAADGGTVSLGDDVTLKIPAGALLQDATVTITKATEDKPAPDELEGTKAVGAAFNIDVGDQQLAKPVTLEIAFDPEALPSDSSEDVVFLAFYDEDKKGWVPVGGQVDKERSVLIIETDHLSWWNKFSWNWDAWIAVLKKLLSLRITDWIEAVNLLTEKCERQTTTVTVDESKANNIVQGCVTKEDPPAPELRVVNLKSFYIGVSAAPDGPGYPAAIALAPGEAAHFTANTADTPPAVVFADFTEEAMWTFVASLAVRMLPSGEDVPGEGLRFIAEGLKLENSTVELAEALDKGDARKAAEAFYELVTSDTFIETLVKRAVQYGQEHGLSMMTKWTQAGVRKVFLAVGATDVIISAWDFVWNYFLNNHSQVAFNWVVPTPDCPVNDPGFCRFATDAAAAAAAGDVAWFADNISLSACPVPFPPGTADYAGATIQFCESDPCLPVGPLLSEYTCVAASTFRDDLSESLSRGMSLFGLMYPEVGLFGENSRSSDEGPALLLGGAEDGKMLVAQMVGGTWAITTVLSMHPSSLYLNSPDIEYWLDVSGVDQRWLDADLWRFLQSLPEAAEGYRIESNGFSAGTPSIEITLYAILNRPDQWCGFLQQTQDFADHALAWIRAQGVAPEALAITWEPMTPSEAADNFGRSCP